LASAYSETNKAEIAKINATVSYCVGIVHQLEARCRCGVAAICFLCGEAAPLWLAAQAQAATFLEAATSEAQI
jgi:hypothetical protein